MTPPKSPVGVYHFSVAGFLIALVLLLIGSPFLQYFKDGDLVESVLFTLVLVSAVLAVGRRRRVFVAALILLAPAFAGRWLYHFWPNQMLPDIHLIASVAFVAFIIIQLLGFIFRAPDVNSEVLCAGVSTYLMLGLLWATVYSLAAYRIPGSFVYAVGQKSPPMMTVFTSLYFSFITLSTVGYGDIMPASDVTRMLAAAEAVTGTLFVAVLISRLVSMHATRPPEKEKACK